MELRRYITRTAVLGFIGFTYCALPHSCNEQTIPYASVVKESPLEKAVVQASEIPPERQYESVSSYKPN